MQRLYVLFAFSMNGDYKIPLELEPERGLPSDNPEFPLVLALTTDLVELIIDRVIGCWQSLLK